MIWVAYKILDFLFRPKVIAAIIVTLLFLEGSGIYPFETLVVDVIGLVETLITSIVDWLVNWGKGLITDAV